MLFILLIQIIKFSDYIEVTLRYEYDRRADKPRGGGDLCVEMDLNGHFKLPLNATIFLMLIILLLQIIKFSDYIEVTPCHEYDRRADKPWTRLT